MQAYVGSFHLFYFFNIQVLFVHLVVLTISEAVPIDAGVCKIRM